MRRGLRSDPWFEFGAPMAGASSFSLRLATKSSSSVSFEQAVVELDELESASKPPESSSKLLGAPLEIETTPEGLQAQVVAIEATPTGRMRWHLSLWNRGEKEWKRRR